MTALHSASASLLAKRQGKEDTLRLLRCQSRSLLHKIDMDGKMKKMAELQLSVIKEQKSRKAVESQVSVGLAGPGPFRTFRTCQNLSGVSWPDESQVQFPERP